MELTRLSLAETFSFLLPSARLSLALSCSLHSRLIKYDIQQLISLTLSTAAKSEKEVHESRASESFKSNFTDTETKAEQSNHNGNDGAGESNQYKCVSQQAIARQNHPIIYTIRHTYTHTHTCVNKHRAANFGCLHELFLHFAGENSIYFSFIGWKRKE